MQEGWSPNDKNQHGLVLRWDTAWKNAVAEQIFCNVEIYFGVFLQDVPDA
jgi:hypothetical protein